MGCGVTQDGRKDGRILEEESLPKKKVCTKVLLLKFRAK